MYGSSSFLNNIFAVYTDCVYRLDIRINAPLGFLSPSICGKTETTI